MMFRAFTFVFGFVLFLFGRCGCGCVFCFEGQNGGLKTAKNGPRVWAFCKIEFPGIQKPVQILTQKSSFFRNPGNRGVGVIWPSVAWVDFIFISSMLCWLLSCFCVLLLWIGRDFAELLGGVGEQFNR